MNFQLSSTIEFNKVFTPTRITVVSSYMSILCYICISLVYFFIISQKVETIETLTTNINMPGPLCTLLDDNFECNFFGTFSKCKECKNFASGYSYWMLNGTSNNEHYPICQSMILIKSINVMTSNSSEIYSGHNSIIRANVTEKVNPGPVLSSSKINSLNNLNIANDKSGTAVYYIYITSSVVNYSISLSNNPMYEVELQPNLIIDSSYIKNIIIDYTREVLFSRIGVTWLCLELSEISYIKRLFTSFLTCFGLLTFLSVFFSTTARRFQVSKGYNSKDNELPLLIDSSVRF